MARKILITVSAILLVLSSVAYVNRAKIRAAFFENQKQNLPAPVTYQDAQKKIGFVNGQAETVDIIPVEADLKKPPTAATGTIDPSQPAEPQPSASSTIIPEGYNLGVPFVSQAPFGIWDATHKETCEEASVLMAAQFVKGVAPQTLEANDRELLSLVAWENKNLGFWEDTNAAETARMLREFYGLRAEVRYDISFDDIKKAVADGFPVIVPAAGRELQNPYYTAPGPIYHMVVVRGFTKTKIIVNDPGTKHGENFTYDNDLFFNAIHDWNKGADISQGRKAMIVVGR
jgi:hypothetical protein